MSATISETFSDHSYAAAPVDTTLETVPEQSEFVTDETMEKSEAAIDEPVEQVKEKIKEDAEQEVHAEPQLEQQQQMEQAEEAQKEVEQEEEEKVEVVQREEELQEVPLEQEVQADATAEVVVVEEKKGFKLFAADGRAARFYRSVRSLRIGKAKKEKMAQEEAMDTVAEEKAEDTVEEKKEETEKTVEDEKKEEEKVEEKVEEKKEEPKVTRRGTFYASVRARLARNKKTAEDKAAVDPVVEYTVATGAVTVPGEDTVAAEEDGVPTGAVPTVEDAVAKEVEAGEHDDKLDTTQEVVEKTAWKTRFAQRVRGVFRKNATAPVAVPPTA